MSAFLNSVPAMARRANAPVYLVWKSAAREFVISTDSAGASSLDEFKIDPKINITAPSAPVLKCDVMARVFIGTSTVMMNGIQTLSLRHARVTDSSAPTFRLSIPPLWAVLTEQV